MASAFAGVLSVCLPWYGRDTDASGPALCSGEIWVADFSASPDGPFVQEYLFMVDAAHKKWRWSYWGLDLSVGLVLPFPLK
jgi:hypothetical protein